jgi:hypothetical protein
MIRRLFYFSLGAFAAVWTMRKLRALHPDHLARRAAATTAAGATAVREFASDVRHLTAGRETELRTRYGLDSVENGRSVENRSSVESRSPENRSGRARVEVIEDSYRETPHRTHHDVKDGR